MGVSYEFQDASEAALMEYQKAVLLDPSAFPPQLRLGILGAQSGQTALAIQALTTASKIDPDDMQARYVLAMVYSSVRDFDRAAEQYEVILNKLVAVEPKNPESYTYLADLYFSQGKVEQAIAQFEKLLRVLPENTDALLQVGAFYLSGKKRPEGIDLLKRCVQVDPAQANCLNALGYAYAEDNVHLDQAAEMVIKALAAEPDNAAYLDSMGWIYYRQGRHKEALGFLERALVQEKDPAIYDHIGDVYDKLGQADRAVEMWREAVVIDKSMTAVQAKIERARKGSGKK